MNARDRIAVILKHTGFDGEEVEIMLDDFAHELAEVIRARAEFFMKRRIVEVSEGMHEAADRIDPKVEK